MDFQSAINESNELVSELAQGSATAAERLEFLLSTTETARGFFVALLTSDKPVADEPPPVLLDALRKMNDDAQTVLVKNLVMSTATAVIHRRNGDNENLGGSQTVARRSINLITKTNTFALTQKLRAMKDSLNGTTDTFEKFLYRLGYDAEQMDSARDAVNSTLAKLN